jgi:hypothetical protein
MPSPKRSDFSVVVILSKVYVHRFAVVRVRIKRRIIGALDLIIRRGAFATEGEREQKDKPPEPKVMDLNPDSKMRKIISYHPALANHKYWIRPSMYSCRKA